ncbi:MAG: replication-associated recombination protein A [Candidatus Kapaibacteriota bacterium]
MDLFNNELENKLSKNNLISMNQSNLEFIPLPERMRPKRVEDIIGQKHLLGENSPFTKFFSKKFFPSIIFWGPPGTGKTTLANLIADYTNSRFIKISAIDSGIKDIREIIEQSKKLKKSNKNTILFIDEIHRFNKSQQDILLDAIEKGVITLVGATTENPSFEINPALLSRCNVYILKNLEENELKELIQNALIKDPIISKLNVQVEEWDFLIRYSGGDGRSILKALETTILFFNDKFENKESINLKNEHFESALQQQIAYYDKNRESHYDNISAMIKSLRGSDPDAAMLWVAKMLNAGEDPKFIVRRLIIFASEDIGNADPNALNVAVNVFKAVEVIGMPECRINIAQAIVYLALAPKSNSSYMAIEKALAYIKSTYSDNLKVPLKLRNAPTKLMKNIGYGEEYKYPHDYDENFIPNENYFPDEIKPQSFYNPTENGTEKKLFDRLKKLWNR